MALGHKALAFFYLQLAQNLEAGLPLAQALRGAGGPPAASIEQMAGWIERGGSVEQALQMAGEWLPRAERPLLNAAATSGRLPTALHRLAAHHTQLRTLQRQAMLACAYPLFLLHFALLLFPVLGAAFSGQTQSLTVPGYLFKVVLSLLPVWGVLGWLVVLARQESPLLGRLADWLPFFRGYWRSQALADFTFTLGNLLDAGVIADQAWRIAGEASPSSALRAAGQKIHEAAAQGEPPGLHLPRFACFPKEYAGLYRAGEVNGQLDHNLRLLAEQSHEQARLCLQLAARAYATLVFLLVAGTIGYLLISSVAGYFKTLSSFS
jgi:type II secretory pathway component PulF